MPCIPLLFALISHHLPVLRIVAFPDLPLALWGEKACEISHRARQHEFACFSSEGNGLASEALISSEHNGKKMAVR